MILLEISLALLLILSGFLDSFLQGHAMFRASDNLGRIVVILTFVWLGLIFYRWICLS